MSQDYLNNKKQFQLHSLITEQRHPRTWNLSQVLGGATGEGSATVEGLKQILSVDVDISNKFREIAADQAVYQKLEQASKAIERALCDRDRKIYIYGCGSTGRLAK